jgi:hypothetical protein
MARGNLVTRVTSVSFGAGLAPANNFLADCDNTNALDQSYKSRQLLPARGFCTAM